MQSNPTEDHEELDDFEEEMYALLDRALWRAECAARAAARIEFDVVQKHLEQQMPPTTDSEEIDPEATQEVAEQASREFNASHFQSTFFNLNVLKVVGELIDLLELDHLEEEVMHTLVHEMFRPRGSSSNARSGEGETFVGTDADLLFHRLRQIAERKQRGRR